MSSQNIVYLPTQQEAQNQAYADASTSGARVFLCHIYEQGNRIHMNFSLPFNLLLELGRLNSAKTKDNKTNAEQYMNRPLLKQHVDEIATYLLEIDNYIIPPLIFNSKTPIKVFAFGTGAVKFGYSVIPSNVELYVTDGQHRLKAIEKAVKEKPRLLNDSATILVIHENDIDQIHQDFADCAKNKPIPPALLAVFDVNDAVSRLTRQIAKDLIIFQDRIDQLSRSIGKNPTNIMTMNQLRVGVAEFIFGTSRKQVIEARSNQIKGDLENLLEQAKFFYNEFAHHNIAWQSLLQPSSQTVTLDLYDLRQRRIDFNTVGFQIISRVGHFIFFNQTFSQEQKIILIHSLAGLDYSRDCHLWQNALVIDDGKGGKRIVAQVAAINKGFRIAIQEVEKITRMQLVVK